jgi:diguanylate cyclase
MTPPAVRLTKQLRVLIVGDAGTLAAQLEAVSAGNCSTEVCLALTATADRVTAHRYDAVVVDMPESAWDDMAALRALVAACSMVPVILLAHDDDPRRQEQSLRHGVQDCLIRTEIDAALLLRSIVYAIERKGLDNRLKATLGELAEANARLQRMTTRDPLTGALNRRAFLAAVEQSLMRSARRGQRVALLYFDLDGFKQINDRLGHAAGDRLLVGFCRRVVPFLRRSDHIARLGGDEYAALIEDVDDPQGVHAAARRIMAALERPLLHDGHTIVLRASIGIALGGDDSNADKLLRQADAAMYNAKQNRSGVAFYDVALDRQQRTRAQLGEDLIHCGRDEMRIDYRRILDAQGRLTWVEALLSWQHPIYGRLAAPQFVPLASGAVLRQLTSFVLQQVSADWQRHPVTVNARGLWLNLTAAELSDPDLPSQVSALRRTGQAVCLSFVEDGILRNIDAARDTMLALRRAGAQLALDCFGAGELPLAALPQLPICHVRLSPAALSGADADPPRQCLALIRFAHELGLQVAAPAHILDRQSALALGCDLIPDDASERSPGFPASTDNPQRSGLPWVEPDTRRWQRRGGTAPLWKRRHRRSHRTVVASSGF